MSGKKGMKNSQIFFFMKGSLAGRGTLSLQRDMKLDYGQGWRQSNSRKWPPRRAIGEDVKIGSLKGCCAVRSADAFVFTGRHIPEEGFGWKQGKKIIGIQLFSSYWL